MISQKVALMNEVPEGAYIVEVVSGSPADKAGIREGDIIIKVDGKALKDLEGELAKAISQKKVGETLELEVYRDEKTFKKAIILEEFSQ
jgi:S1-C subfamily serine protease